MIGLVFVTHGRLGEELRAIMEHVVGPQRDVATVNIGVDDDTESKRADVHRAIEEVDSGGGVVLLTDMLGGTPSNLCVSQMARSSVEVLAGVNLPMLVKLAKVRAVLPMRDAIACAQAAGRKYIASASDVLPECRGGMGAILLDPLIGVSGRSARMPADIAGNGANAIGSGSERHG